MPDKTASGYVAVFLIVVRNLNAVQNTLRCCNLIRTHDHQHLFRSENTVSGDDVKQRVLGKEGFGKIYYIRNYLVIGIGPVACKLKAVAGLGLLGLAAHCILDCIDTGSIRVILGQRTVGDNKNLHIFEESAARPEGITLVTLNLVERFADRHSPAL